MIKTEKILSGPDIYDYANSLLGGFDNMVNFLALNSFLGSLNCSAEHLIQEGGGEVLQESGSSIITGSAFSQFAGQVLNYETTWYQGRTPQLAIIQTPVSNNYTYTGRNGQSIYDVALIVHGGFDNMVQLMIDSGVNSVNKLKVEGVSFSFNTDMASDFTLRNVIQKRQYTPATLSDDSGAILTEVDEFINQESGGNING